MGLDLHGAILSTGLTFQTFIGFLVALFLG